MENIQLIRRVESEDGIFTLTSSSYVCCGWFGSGKPLLSASRRPTEVPDDSEPSSSSLEKNMLFSTCRFDKSVRILENIPGDKVTGEWRLY